MEYAALTDVGIKRHNNEDSYIVNEANNIYIVADGMGGHNAGEIASLEACRIIESYILHNKGDIADVLREAVVKANRDIFVRAAENSSMQGMGTTIDACVVRDGVINIAHVGDSRVYIISKDSVRKVTRDHSVVGMMLEEGSITEEEAKNHPQRNYITRAVGSTITVDVDIVKEKLHDGEWVLMCTDGLTNMVSENVILSVVTGSKSASEGAGELVRLAKENGGDDNITVVLLKV
ncbi:MAG: Stp1/IreP family PP2C-type Ser/Thr phosphatase [Clostridia bacterium]|nr:Stp1/IreP family PP2C-type Ser/Thr phosphatase [Clostridia bacterium]